MNISTAQPRAMSLGGQSFAATHPASVDADLDLEALGEWSEPARPSSSEERSMPVFLFSSQELASTDGVEMDATSSRMLHFLLVVAVAALLAITIGTSSRSGKCPDVPGYSRCSVWQDVRSIVSFLLGALLFSVCYCTKDESPIWSEQSGGRKVQLYRFLF